MGNCSSHLKNNKVSPEGKQVASSPAKNKSRLSSIFKRKNGKNETINCNSQVDMPAPHLTASKHEVCDEGENNTSAGIRKRPLSCSTFIVPYEKSILRQNPHLCQNESISSETSLESGTTPWPRSDSSREVSLHSFILCDENDEPEPKQAVSGVLVSGESVDAVASFFESSNVNCVQNNRTIVGKRPHRPKKNMWRVPVYTDPLIVGDKKAKVTPPKTAFESWIDEVDKLLLGDACGADMLLHELDEINSIQVINQATKSNNKTKTKKIGTVMYKCDLPRPKTRRGPITKVVSSNQNVATKKVNRDAKTNHQGQQAAGGSKQQIVYEDPVRRVRDTPTCAAEKSVRLVLNNSSDTKPVTEDVGGSLEKGCLKNYGLTTSGLVYDETELVLIEQIEKEYGSQ